MGVAGAQLRRGEILQGLTNGQTGSQRGSWRPRLNAGVPIWPNLGRMGLGLGPEALPGGGPTDSSGPRTNAASAWCRLEHEPVALNSQIEDLVDQYVVSQAFGLSDNA